MHTVQILNQLVESHQVLAYLVIFFGIIFEGEVIVITSGVLSYLGALNFWWALSFIVVGGLIKSFSCYYIGILLNQKYHNNKFFLYIEKRALYFMPKFKEKPFWSIFISKFIMGVNYMVIILSGYNKINFKTFLKAEILATVIWAPLLLSLGFFFSQTALSVTKELGKFSLMIFFLVALFLSFDKLVASFYRISQYFKNGNSNNQNNGK